MYEYFFSFFFNLIPNFSDFVNSDDCIVKLYQNLLEYIHSLLENKIEVNEK